MANKQTSQNPGAQKTGAAKLPHTYDTSSMLTPLVLGTAAFAATITQGKRRSNTASIQGL
ncbi:hypothetical protein HMPREF3192_01332 [Atopobium deltae]|uniref:Uncharacterized protein n=1 Tax=Atopobium deltae TaxID=1393034 RepID=A0A133XPW2_9ACTN|nr:hypothetical protein HMPREF3192_01332 [Atopobium deltae]